MLIFQSNPGQLMVTGRDGTTVGNPGYPHDGAWQLRWEGLMAFCSVDPQPDCIN